MILRSTLQVGPAVVRLSMKRQTGHFWLPLARRSETSVNPGALCLSGAQAWRTHTGGAISQRGRWCRSTTVLRDLFVQRECQCALDRKGPLHIEHAARDEEDLVGFRERRWRREKRRRKEPPLLAHLCGFCHWNVKNICDVESERAW